MKTTKQYLSGKHDEELRVLVAEARGFVGCSISDLTGVGVANMREKLPLYPTSRDACEELLADLTEEEWYRFHKTVIGMMEKGWHEATWSQRILTLTARQICVAYLIVKGVLK